MPEVSGELEWREYLMTKPGELRGCPEYLLSDVQRV